MNNPWDEINTPKHDILSRRVSADHPLSLFWGRDSYGRFLFIHEFAKSDIQPDEYPNLKNIQIHLLAPEKIETDKFMLILVLKDESDWHIFLSLCNDIISATEKIDSSPQATSIILRRLKKWQEFLKKNSSGLLSEMEIKGLIGELFFLKKHLTSHFGIGTAVKFWQGPENTPQDFNVQDCAIEVKCQSGTTSPHIRISSEYQLCSQLPVTYIYVITLGKCNHDYDGAINLPILINHIRHLLEIEAPNQFEDFNNLLYLTGYIDSEEYERFTYIPVSETMFLVDENFPKICLGQLPKGVNNISYDVNLLDCKPFIATPKWMSL